VLGLKPNQFVLLYEIAPISNKKKTLSPFHHIKEKALEEM
jgi:hypothetical protein